MKYKYQEAIFSAVMLVLGLFLLVHTYAGRYQNLLTGDDVLAPMFYPRVVLTGWCLMAAGMTVNALRLPGTLHKAFNVKQVALAMLMMAAMLALLVSFGFLAGAIPFVFCFSLFLGYRRKWRAAAAATAIPLLLYLLFDKGLAMNLPTPIWQF